MNTFWPDVRGLRTGALGDEMWHLLLLDHLPDDAGKFEDGEHLVLEPLDGLVGVETD